MPFISLKSFEAENVDEGKILVKKTTDWEKWTPVLMLTGLIHIWSQVIADVLIGQEVAILNIFM